MRSLTQFGLSERQFATLIGRCRLYPYLSTKVKDTIEPLLFGDQQVGTVCRDYYKDRSFCRDQGGDINLWKLYNLFTGANKSSYIDSFLERSVGASRLVDALKKGLESPGQCWYLN